MSTLHRQSGRNPAKRGKPFPRGWLFLGLIIVASMPFLMTLLSNVPSASPAPEPPPPQVNTAKPGNSPVQNRPAPTTTNEVSSNAASASGNR